MPTVSSSASGPRAPRRRMTLSQRLIRAGLTFIVFGIAAALLPAGDITAVSAGPCPPPTFVYVLSPIQPYSGSSFVPGTPPAAPDPFFIGVVGSPKGFKPLSAFLSMDGGVTFANCTDPPFGGGSLTIQVNNDPTSAGPLTADSSLVGGPVVSLPPSGVAAVPLPPTVSSVVFYAGMPGTPGAAPTTGFVQFTFVYGGLTFMDSRTLTT